MGFDSNPAGQIFYHVRNNDLYSWTGHYAVNRNYTANGLNQYSAIGATTPAYDDNRGNLTAAASPAYGYSRFNRLIIFGAHSLGYDALGRLVSNSAGTTALLVSDGDDLIGEHNADGSVARRYVPGPGIDEPVVWYEGAGTGCRRCYHADERGSIIAVSDGSGAVTQINRYDEYGIPASTNSGRFQYTGQQWLDGAGL